MSRYVFIDGEAILQFVADAAQRLTPEEDAPINYDFMRRSFGADRVFFYDAYPTKRPGEDDDKFTQRLNEKIEFLGLLSRLDTMHVRTGTTRHRKKRGLEQKGVDIQLAIEVYQHAVRGNIETAIIVTNDLDFYPLLDALTQTRVRTELRYDRDKTSAALIEAADIAKPLSLVEFASWCDRPYSRNSRINEVSRPDIPEEMHEISVGVLQDQKVAVYSDAENGGYMIRHGTGRSMVLCNNIAAGIDWIEIKFGGRVKFRE